MKVEKKQRGKGEGMRHLLFVSCEWMNAIEVAILSLIYLIFSSQSLKFMHSHWPSEIERR